MSYDLLRAEIAARRDGLSPRLRQIADFALASPSDMALETVAGIARKAGGVRTSRSFGGGGRRGHGPVARRCPDSAACVRFGPG